MSVPPRKIQLLWAEDDPLLQIIIEFAFENTPDIILRLYPSGQTLLEAAQQDRPDLIFLDVVMPHMDGPTTLARLRDMPSLRAVPVVFVTAETGKLETQTLLDLGAAGIIHKPQTSRRKYKPVRP